MRRHNYNYNDPHFCHPKNRTFHGATDMLPTNIYKSIPRTSDQKNMSSLPDRPLLAANALAEAMVEFGSSDSSEIVLPLSSRQDPVPEPVSSHRRTWLSQRCVPASASFSSQSVPTAPVERNFDFDTMWTELSEPHIQRHALPIRSSKRSSQQYLGIGAELPLSLILNCIRFHVGLLGKLFVQRKIFDRPGFRTAGHGRHCVTEMAPLVSRQPVPTLEVCHAWSGMLAICPDMDNNHITPAKPGKRLCCMATSRELFTACFYKRQLKLTCVICGRMMFIQYSTTWCQT